MRRFEVVHDRVEHGLQVAGALQSGFVTPASWKSAFPIDFDQGGPSAMRDILAAQGPLLAAAVAGLPSLGVPTGVVDGLPTGVQVVADKFREDLCFEVGEAIERAADMGTPIDPKS